MDTPTLSDFIEYFVEVCKHFKARYNDKYVSLQIFDGSWFDVPYDMFIKVYLSSFIQTMMSDDSGGDK